MTTGAPTQNMPKGPLFLRYATGRITRSLNSLLITAKDSREQGSWANQGFETYVSKWIYFLHFDQLNPQHSESTIVFLHYLNGRNAD